MEGERVCFKVEKKKKWDRRERGGGTSQARREEEKLDNFPQRKKGGEPTLKKKGGGGGKVFYELEMKPGKEIWFLNLHVPIIFPPERYFPKGTWMSMFFELVLSGKKRKRKRST